LVELAIEGAGVSDPRVLAAMRRVPRHRFVPEAVRREAYANRPLTIGYGQTISQPYIVAAMTEAAKPTATDQCLEIGTGSGYQAAVLAEVCGRVFSIEYLPKVAEFGAANLKQLGYGDRVELRVGDGYLGWPQAAPFQVIVVTAAPPQVPEPLMDQLAVGGRLVIPVGSEHGAQQLERWTRVKEGRDESAFERESLMGVRFVPFLGDYANPDD
jgi:protein-L-isoaspartate(D-aspartate) O-methyltransferase